MRKGRRHFLGMLSTLALTPLVASGHQAIKPLSLKLGLVRGGMVGQGLVSGGELAISSSSLISTTGEQLIAGVGQIELPDMPETIMEQNDTPSNNRFTTRPSTLREMIWAYTARRGDMEAIGFLLESRRLDQGFDVYALEGDEAVLAAIKEMTEAMEQGDKVSTLINSVMLS
jgi:hypothetical protein